MRTRVTLGLVAAGGLVLAGCESVPDGARDAQAYECPLGEEGCDDNVPIGPGGELSVIASANGEFSFGVPDPLTVTGPEITVAFENVGAGPHNVEVLGGAEGSELIEAGGGGGTAEGNFALFPGQWTIICEIPGHRENGMEATITVFATEAEYDAAVAAGEDPNAEVEGDDAGDAADGDGEGEGEGGDEGGTGGDTAGDGGAGAADNPNAPGGG